MSVEAKDERSLFQLPAGSSPYEFLAELREQCPVHWDPGLAGYILTRYDDVFNVMRSAEDYRLHREQYSEHQKAARVTTFRNLLNSKVTAPYMETMVKPVIDKLISKFEANGKAELHADLAISFPASVIGLLFGLEESDFEDLFAYRDARSRVFDAPEGPAAEEAARVSAQWQEKIDARMREVLAAHREQPRDNLLSLLLTMEEDGKPIPDEEIMQIAVRDILVAGSETATRSTCNAIYRALTLPGMYERLRDDHSLIPDFVEESLRYDPPVHVFWRAANHDAEISGCPIAKDTQLYPSLAAANRDPEAFENPDEFDTTRKKGRHLTFSVGPHRCPGHWVGRTETEIALAMVLDRLPNLRLDPDAPEPVLDGVILRVWSPLHVLFDPAS
jgi:cytochrome P450